MHTRRIRRSALSLLSVAAVTLAAWGGDVEGGGATTATPPTSAALAETEAPAETAGAAHDAEWQAIVDAANEEGSVTIFTNQLPGQMESFEAAFETEYPDIDVEIVRGLITENQPRIEAERESGQDTADFIVSFDKGWVETRTAEGWSAPPVGPSFSSPEYDREQFLHDDAWFEVSASIVPIMWNTDLYPNGLTSYEDLLDPELAGGRIGVVDIQSGIPMVDFYVYLADLYGPEFVEQLSAQEPTIYAGTGPIMAAVAAGEIAVSLWGIPPIAEQEAGAPLEFVIPEESFGSRGYGFVYERAPHPNAAQVAADFMLSPEGQANVTAYWASVLPDVPGALAEVSQIRELDLDRLTEEFVADTRARWEELFR